jgi:hypothetical protein
MTPETSQPKFTDDLIDALAVEALRSPALDDPTPSESKLTAEDLAALDKVDFSDVIARVTEKKS